MVVNELTKVWVWFLGAGCCANAAKTFMFQENWILLLEMEPKRGQICQKGFSGLFRLLFFWTKGQAH